MKWMTSASQPSSRSVAIALRSSSSSRGMTTRPCASMRSVTSSRSSRGISASNEPARPQLRGRVRRPSSRASRNPRVATSPHFAPLRSRIALVATVVPCTTVSIRPAGAPLAAIPDMKPSACAPGVLATLAISNRPDAPSKENTSVKVPPTSTPRRYLPRGSFMSNGLVSERSLDGIRPASARSGQPDVKGRKAQVLPSRGLTDALGHRRPHRFQPACTAPEEKQLDRRVAFLAVGGLARAWCGAARQSTARTIFPKFSFASIIAWARRTSSNGTTV